MAQVKFEGILWDKDWMMKKTFDQFYAHEMHHGLSKDKMVEAYTTITGKKVTIERPKSESNGQKDFGTKE